MKVTVKDITIQFNKPLQEIIGNNFHLVKIEDLYLYIDGKKTDKKIGYTYEIVCLNKGYEKIKVKVEDLTNNFSHLSKEELLNGVAVDLKDLTYKIWTSVTNNFLTYNMSFTANAVMPLTTKKQ